MTKLIDSITMIPTKKVSARFLLGLICLFAFGQAFEITPLDEYVSFDDGHLKWHEEKHLEFKTLLGATAHVLNVTS